MSLFDQFNSLGSLMQGLSTEMSIPVREDQMVADPEPTVKVPESKTLPEKYTMPLEGATVEQIHNEFDTAPERLLKEAKKIIEDNRSQKKIYEEAKSKNERLTKLGFTNIPDAKENDKLLKEYKGHVDRVELSKKESEDISYYNKKYPFLKFLTEDELDRICKKYGLSYAPVSRYTKNVPEKNLKEIEKAQILCEEDAPYDMFIVRGYQDSQRFPLGLVLPLRDMALSKDGYGVRYNHSTHFQYLDIIKDGIRASVRDYSILRRSGLFIAAPKDHFDTEGLEESGLGFFQSVPMKIEDPVVFRYVRGGVQVLSKWGEEANDPALQVGVNN